MHNGAIISIEPRLCIKLDKCLICKNNKKTSENVYWKSSKEICNKQRIICVSLKKLHIIG